MGFMGNCTHVESSGNNSATNDDPNVLAESIYTSN